MDKSSVNTVPASDSAYEGSQAFSASSTLPPASVSFSGRMSDAELNVVTAGFSIEPWVPEHGWTRSEKEASEDPYPPQKLAALQCFIAFFVNTVERFWVHLAAEMQAGKTGVVTALIRIMLANYSKIKISPHRIFVLTGMNDNAWKKQTLDRLPHAIRTNVHHNGGLSKFAKAITDLADDSELNNVLIVIDESHLASCLDNRPHKLIYETVNRLCPQAKWAENNIRFLTISATDPAKVLAMRGEETAQVVRLQTSDEYQSIQKLAAAERTRWLEEFGDIHKEKAIRELKRCISEEFSDAPRYHIIRARSGKTVDVIENLRTAFPGCPVLKYDSEEKNQRSTADDKSSLSGITDINEILLDAPSQHTFIVIKNMFYAAKTLEDKYVGVLWDRLSGKDDTNLQSLLGRACGYGKSSRTIVYAAKATVDNYQTLWRELCSNPKLRMDPVLTGIPVVKMARRMPGLVANRTGLAAASDVAVPTMTGDAAAAAGAGGGTSQRKVANDADFEHTVQEFSSLESAKFRGMRTPKKDEDGFYLTSTTDKPLRLSYATVLAICNGKKTSNLAWTDLDVGKTTRRLYVGYKDMSNPNSAVFVVRSLTRLR
jgi:hypothetical protein